MNVRVFAALLGVCGVLLSACSPNRGAATSPHLVFPAGIIRSQSDLQRYLAVTAGTETPFNALSGGARARFLSSLTFNEKGITGFHYGDLQSELTASQIVAVLRLFGVEKDVTIIPSVRVETTADKRAISSYVGPPYPVDGDHKGYWCASRATCAPSNDSICTSNC